MNKRFAGLLLGTALALPAQALILDGVTTQGATVVQDYSGAGLMAFDIDLHNGAPVVLSFVVEEADLAGPISFNAVIRNLSGQGLEGLAFSFSSGGIAQIGTVTRFFGGQTELLGGGGELQIRFTPAEYYDVELGDAFGSTAGAANWVLQADQWVGGTRFDLVVSSVPEPASAALLLAGLGLVGRLASRRRKR